VDAFFSYYSPSFRVAKTEGILCKKLLHNDSISFFVIHVTSCISLTIFFYTKKAKMENMNVCGSKENNLKTILAVINAERIFCETL